MFSKQQTTPHILHNLKDSSLIFQFMLSEFFKTAKQVMRLETLLSEYQQEPSDSFHKLLCPLKELCGSSPHYALFFSWGFDEGILNKFRNYIQIYITLKGHSKELLILQDIVEKGSKEAISALELLREAELEKTSLYFRDPIEKHLKLALRSLKKLPKIILNLLFQFKKDENVLFFLLRFQHSFCEIYSKRTLRDFFEKINSKGIEGVNNFIIKQYSKRGFNQLKKPISEQFNLLKT